MASIKIERPAEWMNMARSYGIYINGKKVGKIQNGETKIYKVKPGINKIHSKIDWCESQDVSVNVSEGEMLVFRISSFKYASLMIGLLMGLLFLNLLIHYFLNVNFTGFVFLPFTLFLYFIYYLTFGRHKYLRIEKEIQNKKLQLA